MKTKAGFSLVEILIVLAIMAIMTGVILAQKNSDTASKDVDAAVQQVVAQLRNLQNDALNGKQIDSTTVSKFKFSYSNPSSGSNYTVDYLDSSDKSIDSSSFTINLKSTVKFLTSSNLTFVSPFGGVTGSRTITIASVKDGTQKNICIESGGNIEALTGTCPN